MALPSDSLTTLRLANGHCHATSLMTTGGYIIIITIVGGGREGSLLGWDAVIWFGHGGGAVDRDDRMIFYLWLKLKVRRVL